MERGRRLWVLAVLAVAAGGAATDAQPRGTATTGTLAFHRSISLSGDTGGPFLDDIYTMNADGTRMRNLTRNRVRVHAWAPAWSHDGARIAFLRRIDGRRRDAVVVMNADGSEPRQVTETTLGDFGAVALSWAPGGRRIAFVRNGGIWVVRADGTARRRLIRDAGQPAWSPDGSTIAFVRKLRDDDSSAEIFVANPDGTGQRRLTRNSYGETAPAWSPTGDRIAFGRYAFGIGRSGIRVMRPNGIGVRRVTRSDQDCCPSWSPDARSIAFCRSGGVAVVGANGGRARKLSDGQDHCSVAWSPSS